MIAIHINGEQREVAPSSTLADLIRLLELEGQALALAVNRHVIPRQHWGHTPVAARDQIDIVRAIGGG
jgi:sulfur carrier protein